ncbi:hypothetical protein Tco_0529736 [Tanacetum coccineum]
MTLEYRFDESDDEDYMVIYDKNSFSYKIISVDDLKTDLENNNDKVNMLSLPPPEPTVSCFDDLDFFKDFENEFPAIVYNDALTSKSDFLTEPTVSPQHIDEFNLKDETSLSECDEEEQNVLYFNDLFSFNVIYPDDSKSDEDNDDDKIDIEHSSGDLSVKPLPDVINTDDGAYAHGSNKLLETREINRHGWPGMPLEYVPEDHVPVYIPEPEHPEDLVPAEDEAPTPLLPPFFLSPRIRPLSPRALEVEMRDVASAYYHSLHPSGTPPLLPIPLPAPSTSRRADIPEADTPPRKRLLLTTPRPGCEVGESSAAAAARQPGPTMAHRVDHSLVDTMETRFRDTERRMMTALEMVNMRVSYQVDVRSRESSEFYSRHHDAQKDRAAVRAEIEVLRRERLAYEQESIQTRQDLARSEAYCRALEARVTVLETEVRRHEWQRQAADDLVVQHIMRTQALEAGARVDTLEDTGSSS